MCYLVSCQLLEKLTLLLQAMINIGFGYFTVYTHLPQLFNLSNLLLYCDKYYMEFSAGEEWTNNLCNFLKKQQLSNWILFAHFLKGK